MNIERDHFEDAMNGLGRVIARRTYTFTRPPTQRLLTGLTPGATYTLTYTWQDDEGETHTVTETFTQPEEADE